MKKLLWLDDIRDPTEGDWQSYSPISHNEVIWVKSYNEFVFWIKTNGLPAAICFDHDLGMDVAVMARSKGKSKNAARKLKQEEKTGHDCAKWLVNYCIDNEKKLPLYNIQSANPVGKDNIDGLLKNFIEKHQNRKK